MDGNFVATIQFKPNTKNCFVSVPGCWISSIRNESVLVYEVQRKNGQSVYLSWSGDLSSVDDTIELNGFYALKLGLREGEEVFVCRRRDIPAVESVNVEPVSVDDWEILELHTAYIQNNMLSQVRAVWDNQILPIWVNQSVCILVKIGQLNPLFEVGILVNSSELHITPKIRNSNVGPLPALSSNAMSSVITGRPALTSLSKESVKPEEKSSVIGDKSSDGEHSLLRKGHNQHFKSVKSDNNVSKKEILNKIRNWTCIKVTVRVHPLDIPTILDYLNTTNIANSSQSDIKTLLLQPTNVFVTSQTCRLTREKQANPVLFGRLTNIIEVDDSSKSKTKNEKQTKIKVQKQSDVKVILLDYLLDYVGEETELKQLIRKLMNDQSPGAILVSHTIRRVIQSPVSSRVNLEIRRKESSALKPTLIYLFPLNEITFKENGHENIKAKEKNLNAEIDTWRDSICSLSCPLIVNNKLIISVPISGVNHDFLVETLLKNEKQNGSSVIMITPATKLNVKWDVLIKDESLNEIVSTEWDPTAIGPLSVTLGGFDTLIKESKTYLKMCLNLGVLATHLRVGLSCVGGGLMVCGSSGSGKSSIARALARDFSESPFYLYTDYIGCKALKGKRPESIIKTWRKSYFEAHRRHPSIIILDDLDQLVGVAVGPENEIGVAANHRARLSDTLKELMRNNLRDNSNVVTIVTSKSVNSLCQSLVSTQGVHLFSKVIKIPSPNINERIDILKQVILSKPLASPKVIESCAIDWSSLAIKMEGYVPRDLNLVIDRALHLAISKSGSIQDDEEDVFISQDDIEKATIDFIPIALRMLNIHKPGDKVWDDVGGLGEVKKDLIETLQWPSKYPKLFASCPLPMRSGILLYGAPGTGKTLLASVVAKECSMNFISIKGPELLSKYIGASEQSVRDLFERAANAKPCIIFFDEFDSLAPRRGHDSTGVTDRVVNQLLTQMDGVEGRKGVYVLAATSRPDLIDPALLRPGRLDKCLFCPLPTAEEREQILSALSRPINLGDDVNLSEIANLCEHFSGADLQGLLYNAQMDAIHHTVGQLYTMDKSMLELDYVICKKETSAICKLKEDEYKMTHFRNLKDGPEETDFEYLKLQRQKIDSLLSNMEKSSASRRTNDETEQGRHQAVIVHHNNLVQALKEMRPSVGPEDRKRYDKIYEAFIKSRGGHFDANMSLQSLHGNRATLA